MNEVNFSAFLLIMSFMYCRKTDKMEILVGHGREKMENWVGNKKMDSRWASNGGEALNWER